MQIESKKKFRGVEEELCLFKEKIDKLSDLEKKRATQIKRGEQIAVQKAKKVAEEHNQELNKSFDTIQRKIETLTKEVNLKLRKRGKETERSRSIRSKEMTPSRYNNTQLFQVSSSLPISNKYIDLNNVKSNETDAEYSYKQHQIIEKILRLEKDLDQFKSNQQTGVQDLSRISNNKQEKRGGKGDKRGEEKGYN